MITEEEYKKAFEICLENKINLPKWNEKKVLNNLKR